MTFIRHVSILVAAMGVFYSCKSPNGQGPSSLDSARPTTNSTVSAIGISRFAVAHVENGIMQFYKLNSAKLEIERDQNGEVIKSHSIPFAQTYVPTEGIVMTKLKNGSQNLFIPKDDSANYAYETDGKSNWDCDDAESLLTNTPKQGNSNNECFVAFNTEDQSWFTITVIDRGPNGRGTINFTPDATLGQLMSQNKVTRSMTDVDPNTGLVLRPTQANGGISSADAKAILGVMKNWENTYQNASYSNNERVSCLKNGRAANWQDLQSHFYCILPYSPHRQCYSESLVDLTKKMPPNDPAGQLKILIGAFNKSFNDCFGPKGVYPMSPAESAAFRYVMFTKTGLMDFNIDDQNNLINKFYKDVKKERPRRVVDSVPYQENQPRYDQIRQAQKAMRKL